jgi:UrcA family protein
MKTVPSATHLIAAGVVAGAFVVGFLSGPALAVEPQVQDFQFKFEFTQSELASVDGAKQMLARLERKVRRHCDDTGRSLPQSYVGECIDRTMSKAVANFGSAALAEAYKTRTGG